MAPEAPPNRDLVVYALSTMGSISDRFHTEDIAIRCHELFPTAFSWTTRPDLPDKDIVRVALTDARKEKFGTLVEGRTGQSRGQYQKTRRGPMSDGWRLTEAGLDWVDSNRERFEGLLEGSRQRLDTVSKDHRQKSRKKLKRVVEHPLFERFHSAPNDFKPRIGELADLARCRVDAEATAFHQRFEKMKRLGIETQQPEVVGFIEACIAAYEGAHD